MPRKNAQVKDTPGSRIFDPLTTDESGLLVYKLMAGAAAARVVTRDNHDLFMETHDVIGDVQAATLRNLSGK